MPTNQTLTTLEMVRGHAYLSLAVLSSLSLLVIAILLIPQAVKTHRYNRCINAQSIIRSQINPDGQTAPSQMHYLRAVEHCEGL